MKTVKVIGFEITNQKASSIISDIFSMDSISVVNTINAHSYVIQKNDMDFRYALKNSTVLLPDGSGITLAALLMGISVPKLSGYDFFQEIMEVMNKKSGKVFFLGSIEDVLDNIQSRAAIDYPNVSIEFFAPDYKDSFKDEDAIYFANKINNFMPDVLFLGLTAPKQEKLAEKLRYHISTPMVVSIGAVFDFYAQVKKRPHNLLIKLHLEWLGRLISDPRKIFKRVFISMPIFLFIVFFKWLRRDLK
jgi:N-acetylglucosaminyldiphosphoundecaprenol N-acetyl-beta-D-mannosaminyltransferase